MKPPASAATPEQPLDNIQILLQRRAELAKNKAKYSLTETDAKLLSTHAVELHFDDGQVIIEEFKDISQVYRVKSGQIAVSRFGHQINVIGKGWFLGDPMLIYDTPAYVMKITAKAVGPVVLEQLNLPFVQQLFKVDTILHAKFMRHMVSKFSFMFDTLINNLDDPSIRPGSASPSLTPSASASTVPLAKILNAVMNTEELQSESSSSSLSSENSSSSLSDGLPDTPTSSSSSASSSPALPAIHSGVSAALSETTHRPITKREARARSHAAYKSYPLAHRGGGIQTLQIKSTKLKVVSKSFGFAFKTSVDFSKILNISKVGENAVTIVYQPRKVANVFFKNYYDREEFLGLVNSLISHAPTTPISPEASRRHSGTLTVPHNPELNYDEVPLCGGDTCCADISSREVYKQGDIVFEEGDLFQRVYTLTKGHCDILQKGKKVCTMEEGDIFGVGTLLHLRPVPVTLRVASETAELYVLPAFKLNAMIDTDPAEAADIYREAARALDRKMSQALGYLPNYKRLLREKSVLEKEAQAEMKEGVAEVAPQQDVVA